MARSSSAGAEVLEHARCVELGTVEILGQILETKRPTFVLVFQAVVPEILRKVTRPTREQCEGAVEAALDRPILVF